MLCSAFTFAVMGVCASALSDEFPWQAVALVRASVPLVLSAALARAAGVRLVFWRPRTLWVRSICGSLSLIFAFYAFSRLPVSEVITITNLFPIWVALFSWPILKIAPGVSTWVGAFAGVVGVALIQQPQIADGNLTALFAVAASISSGLAMIGLHRLNQIDARAIVVHFSFVSLVFCLAAFTLVERAPLAVHAFCPRNIALLAGVGLSATLGQFFLTKAFTDGPPAKVAIVGLTQVGFGMAFDAVLWGRSFGLLTVVGTILVVAPTAWLLWREERLESADQ